MNDNLNPEQIAERFFVRGRMEILDILNDLVLRGEPTRLHFNGNHESTAVVLLEARGQQLVFEAGSDSAAHQRLLASPACAFVACPDGIRVQFATGPAQRIDWGNSSAFAVPLPEQLARLQRQESFRILIAPEQGLRVTLFADDGASLGEWPLHDLSVGGIGIAARGQAGLQLGPRIARARLQLSAQDTVDCQVTLRHATGLAADDSGAPYRIGLAFSGLPATMQVAIQRYIIDTEHARHSALIEEDDANSHD